MTLPLGIDGHIFSQLDFVRPAPNTKSFFVIHRSLEASEFYRARVTDRFRFLFLSSALAIKINASILARSIFRPIIWNRQRFPLPE
jgi:hypothetical protein